ncbi:WSC-domain-containing protein [Pholiota conissans]|uniref:WSC-domain-containing protein n=1 Tax=Pholiota conissans TaxID=109636 RepID=A0A9P6CY97_9AGAR|nr:WSC-domain-containing protein [Pholiota conissans]
MRTLKPIKQIFLATIVAGVLLAETLASAAFVVHSVARQVNPNGPAAGWTSVGCFTDRGAARTLMATSILGSATMTPAVCTQFCESKGKGFAGVENGQDCWCDGVIQTSANQTAPTDCNTPCKGDATLSCGGASRIEVFTNGAPSPALVTGAEDNVDELLWSYLGCYSDSPTRILGRLTGSAASLEGCVTLCANQVIVSQGTEFFTFAGMENGGECWCDNLIDTTTIQSRRLPDIACAATACPGDPSEACGGPFVMALYQQPTEDEEGHNFFNSKCRSVVAPGPQIPDGTTFSLTAVFKDEPSSSMPINLAVLDTTKTIENGSQVAAVILSACPTCNLPPLRFGTGPFFQFLYTVVEPGNDLSGGFEVTIPPGGTSNFRQITAPYLTWNMGGYCFVLNPLDPSGQTLALTSEVTKIFPTILSPTQTDIQLDMFAPFALCRNNTAGGRMDVVFKGLQNQLGLNVSGCRDIVLTIQIN